MSSGLNSIRLRSHLVAGWTSGFSRGTIKFSTNARPPSFPKCGFSRGTIKLSTNARPPSFPKCMTSSQNRATSGSRWRRWKRRTKFLSPMLRSRQAACLDQLWRALLNTSRKLRSHLRQCDTSSLNASALPLLLVTPDLRRLSRQLNQCQLPRSPELQRIGTMLPFPEAPRTPAQDRLGFGTSEILLNNQAERGGTRVSLPLDHPASSLYCVSRCPAYQRVNVGNDYGKTRLRIPPPIRSKTTALPRCAHHHSAQRERSGPLRRGDESAGKRSHRNRSSSPERVRLLQPLLPHPQKRRWPATYSRSQTPELRPDEKVVQDDHFETDPNANMPRGLVHVTGSERHLLSHPGSPPITDDSWDSHSKGWHINTRPCRLGCPWLPALLHDAWMRLSPLCDRWWSAYSTTSTTGSFWLSRRRI